MEKQIHITVETPTEEGKTKALRYAVSEETYNRIAEILLEGGAASEEVQPAATLPDMTNSFMNMMIPALTGQNKAVIYDLNEKPADKSFEEVLAIYKTFNWIAVDSKDKGTINTRIGSF